MGAMGTYPDYINLDNGDFKMHSRIIEISLEKIEENLICGDKLYYDESLIDYIGESPNTRAEDLEHFENEFGITLSSDTFTITIELINKLKKIYVNRIKKNMINLEKELLNDTLNLSMIKYRMNDSISISDMLFSIDIEVCTDSGFFSFLQENIGKTIYIGGVLDYHF